MKGGGCIRAARASPRDDGRVETGPAEPDLAETGAAAPGAAAMTPRQQEALDRLFRAAGPHPEFPAGVADDLRSRLEDRLADLVPRLVDQRLVVAKHTLTLVHTCEAHYLAETAAGFAWSARAAKGAVAHKAIELSIGMKAPPSPVELVDLAIERLAEDDRGPAPFLAEAPAAELAELRVAAADEVLKFIDEFPTLKVQWRPRLESTLIAGLFDGRIELRGKVDLALGQARGTTARVLIVDFKTGRPAPGHADDLRFYALLETLRCGVPPFRVASWYLDSGRWHAEDVDLQLLEVAARRTADGVRTLVELTVDNRPATTSPGPACRWCVANTTCEAALVDANGSEEDDLAPV